MLTVARQFRPSLEAEYGDYPYADYFVNARNAALTCLAAGSEPKQAVRVAEQYAQADDHGDYYLKGLRDGIEIALEAQQRRRP